MSGCSGCVLAGPEYTNVIFDIHWYQVHDHNEFGNKTVEFNLEYPAQQREKQLKQLERGRRLVFVGRTAGGLEGLGRRWECGFGIWVRDGLAVQCLKC